MTRINLVPPSELCDKHLMAEYRELNRIPNAIWSGKMQAGYIDAPKQYTLGTGHIKFFVNKLLYLWKRQQDLYSELMFREFNVREMIWPEHWIQFFEDNMLFNDYNPSTSEIDLNISRILDKMPENPKFTQREAPLYYEGNYR